MSSRRGVALVAVSVAVVAAVVIGLRWRAAEEESALWQPRHVVLFTVDTWRADRLGVYGYRDADTSPRLDAWAREAIVFDRAFAQAPWTVPSLASFFTGRYPTEMGVFTNETGIGARWQTLAEIFQEAGYATAAFNSHSVLLEEEMGFRRGFDEVYPEKPKLVLDGEHKIPFAAAEPDFMRWIDEHADQRFFVWLHDMDPHQPPTPDNVYLEDSDWHRYDAELRWVDDTFARVVAHLQARGIWDDVLFVLTADHGEAFAEHGILGHQNVMYDEVLRVPLLMYFPAMKGPMRVRESVDLLDVRSTILDIAGLEDSAETAGETLRPILMGEAKRRDRDVSVHSRHYFEDGHHEYAVRDRRWKLIVRTPPSADRLGVGWPTWMIDRKGASYELFNMSIDPHERHDLASRYPDIVARLRLALEDWRGAIARPDDEAPMLDEQHLETLRKLGYNPDSDR
jgi:arylsulfatase A-like enzyme